MTRLTYLDVTSLSQAPIRSGIQRVTRSLLRNWPSNASLVPCAFDTVARRFFEIPPEAVPLLTDADPRIREVSVAAAGRMIKTTIAGRRRRPITFVESKLLATELTVNEAQCRHFIELARDRAVQVHFIAYDMIPWLHPSQIEVRSATLMWYLRMLRTIRNIAYISEQTRQDYEKRFFRDGFSRGPVIPLGADGMTVERQRFSPQRRSFLSIGWITRRKNQHLILQAFRELWACGVEAELVLVGKPLNADGAVVRELEAAKHEPRLRYYPQQLGDPEIAALMRETRALIYVGEFEGFGLPPIESLHAGVPVIVFDKVPSIAMLSPAGQIRLPEVTSAAVAAAVRTMLDDEIAERKWRETESLRLTTWQTHAEAVAAWVLSP